MKNAAVVSGDDGRLFALIVNNERLNCPRDVKLVWKDFEEGGAFANYHQRWLITKLVGKKAWKPGRRPPFSRGRNSRATIVVQLALCTLRKRWFEESETEVAMTWNRTSAKHFGGQKNRGWNGEKTAWKRRQRRRYKRETRRGRRPSSGAPTRQHSLAELLSRD